MFVNTTLHLPGHMAPRRKFTELSSFGLTGWYQLCVSDTVCPFLCPESSAVFIKGQPAHKEVQAVVGASTTLSCEVAQAQTEVTWYKNRKKLNSSAKVRVEAKGCTQRLVVQQVDKADAGEYSCEAGGQKVSFHLDVTGQSLEVVT